MLKLHQLCLYLHNKVNGAILETKEAQILLHISLAVSIGARLTLNIPFLDMVAEFILHKKTISISFEYFDNPSSSFTHTLERSIPTRGIRA